MLRSVAGTLLVIACIALFSANAAAAVTVNPEQLKILKSIRFEASMLYHSYQWTDENLAKACDDRGNGNTGISGCDADGWVTGLNFWASNTPAAPSIGKCKSLQSLNFNSLAGALPSEWSALSQLTSLTLSIQEGYFIPKSWADLKSLQVLFLRGSRFFKRSFEANENVHKMGEKFDYDAFKALEASTSLDPTTKRARRHALPRMDCRSPSIDVCRHWRFSHEWRIPSAPR